MFMAVFLLAQVAAGASAVPTPTPTPGKYDARTVGSSAAPAAQPRGLGGTAGMIKLNRSVSFEQGAVPPQAPPPRAELQRTPAAASATVPLVAGISPERERMYKDRYAAAIVKKDLAIVALGTAEKEAPGCINRRRFVKGGIVGDIDCTARDGSLLPYKMAVSTAEAEIEKARSDCRNDVYCMPYWVTD